MKYVDFPFVTGADGTKLLWPDREILVPRYFAYALRAVDLPSRGYNRHYRLLRDREIRFPEALEEQQAIAAALSQLEAAVTLARRKVHALREFKAATSATVFREGLRRERLRQTEIGELPESWEVRPLGEITELLSGGTPSKRVAEWWEGDIPWASPKDIKQPRLWDSEDHISQAGLRAGSTLAPQGAVLIVVRGMILAKEVPLARIEVPMALNQDLKAVVAGPGLNSEFLLYAIEARREALVGEIGTSAHGTRRLLSSALERLLIPVPADRDEQKEIARVVAAVELAGKVAGDKLLLLTELFDTVLPALTTGSLRLPLKMVEANDRS